MVGYAHTETLNRFCSLFLMCLFQSDGALCHHMHSGQTYLNNIQVYLCSPCELQKSHSADDANRLNRLKSLMSSVKDVEIFVFFPLSKW